MKNSKEYEIAREVRGPMKLYSLTMKGMTRMKSLSAYVFLFIFSCLNSTAFGWSWRDLKIGVTTEEELLKFGGWPEKVVLRTPDYFCLKQGKPYSGRFVYEDSNRNREEVRRIESTGGLVWYDPSKVPILTTAPLQLSDEIERINVVVDLIHGKLSFFAYSFSFHSAGIDKKKYAALFNGILGKPIRIAKGGILKDSIYITYEDGYSVSIDPSRCQIYFYGPLH
jgi:hypothetical protein